ncbi:MAG: hypothetical protein ACLQVL_36835 [Terriglobia bacterium]
MEINFGDGSWDDARGLVQNILQQLVNDVQGNGKDGIKTILSNFIAKYEQNREDNIVAEKKRNDELKAQIEAKERRDDRRWKFLGTILAGLTVLLGFLTYLEANRQVKNHTLTFPSPYLLKNDRPVVSSIQPPQYTYK